MNCFSAIQTAVFSEIFFPPKEVDIFFSYFFFFEELSGSFDTGREICT